MIPVEQLSRLREETPGVGQRIHLNNAGAALMPRPVVQAIQHYIGQESQMGGYEAAAANRETLNGFYQAVAKLLNTTDANIAYAASATDAYNRALSSINFKAGDVLLTTINDYASNQIAFIQLAKRFGVQIIRAKDHTAGGVDVHSMEDLIKRHRPKLVALTHVPTNSGLIQPAEAVGLLCKQHDILYLLDACQSAGQLPLDVEQLHCDFLSATFRKFLRGPRGAGFLYVSDRVLRSTMEPIFLDMLSATWENKNQYKASQNARRFELWEKPFALVMASKIAVEYALDIGLPAIANRVQMLANYGRQKLASIPGLHLLDQGINLCGIITCHLEDHQVEDLKTSLQKAGINVSVATLEGALIDFTNKGVEAALRVSPHYYNTEEEIDRLIEKVMEITKNG